MIKPNQLPSQEELISMFEYDDGKLIWKQCKDPKKNGSVAGTNPNNRNSRYAALSINKKKYPIHRIIYAYFYGNILDDLIVDHIDNNPFNNRIENLRLANTYQSAYNKRMPNSNISGVKGVCFIKSRNKWEVKIGSNGKRIFGGYFNTLEEAKIKINAIREQHHGVYTNHG